MMRFPARNRIIFGTDYPQHNVLQQEVGQRMLDYLQAYEIIPKKIANIFARDHGFSTALSAQYPEAEVIASDSLRADIAECQALPAHQIDLLVSNMRLQDVADIGAFLQYCWQSLAPNGQMMLTMLGFGQLQMQLQSLQDIGLALNPLPDIRQLGDAIHSLGLIDTVLFIEKITLTYNDISMLMADLRVTGARAFTHDFKGLRTPLWQKKCQTILAKHCCHEDQYQFECEIIYAYAKMPEWLGVRATAGEIKIPVNAIQRQKH